MLPVEAVAVEESLERDGAHEAERAKDPMLGRATDRERELFGTRVDRGARGGDGRDGVAEGIERCAFDQLSGAASGDDQLGDQELELCFSDVEPLACAKPCQPAQERESRSTGQCAPPRERLRACAL